MTREIVIVIMILAAASVYGLIRREREKQRAERVQQVITCEVSYQDMDATTEFLTEYFRSNLISVLSEKSFVEGGEDEELYTNVYRLFLPGIMTPAQLVSQLSTCETVQSVHIKTE